VVEVGEGKRSNVGVRNSEVKKEELIISGVSLHLEEISRAAKL
jgi:hypothetical protein